MKFEKSFQKFLSEISRMTEMVEELWKQSGTKNYKILTMFD